MTTILNLPEEILCAIFENLGSEGSMCCQYVCRSWYATAHVLVLENITLNNIREIMKFIKSLGSNPNTTYLNAVKSISIKNLDLEEPTTQLHSSKLKLALFCSFPKLEKICLYESVAFLKTFSDALCTTVLARSPQLCEFQVHLDRQVSIKYYQYIKRVRLLLTKMDIKRIDGQLWAPNTVSIADYIIWFPRLKQISSDNFSINNFTGYLPVFMHLTQLVDVRLSNVFKDKQGFAERYLATLTNEKREQIVKQLSSISNLVWCCKSSFCENAMVFVAKYLTGLNKIAVGSCLDNSWNNARQVLFLDTILKFTRSVNDCRLTMSMTLPVLWVNLPTIIQEVYQYTPRSNKSLRIKMVQDIASRIENITSADMINLHIETNQADYKQDMTITFDKTRSFPYISDILHRMNTNIDKFWLSIQHINDQSEDDSVDTDTYYTLLERLQSVKQLTLGIPATFVEKKPKNAIKLDQLERLTLKASIVGHFQSLLESFVDSCPNIKYMDLHFFSGIWKGIGHYYFDLGRYSLKRLTLDLTPIKEIINKYLAHKDGFFVVQVEKRLYKVLSDLSHVAIINEDDLQNLACAKDYYRVQINVTSLQYLKLCMSTYEGEERDYDYFENPSEELYQITLFNE